MENRKKRGVRSQRRKKQKRESWLKITKYIIGYILIAIIGYMGYGIYQEVKVRSVEYEQYESARIHQEKNLANVSGEGEKKSLDFISVAQKYQGYEVDCRLEIPKINLSTNVLREYTKSGLKICASKYYGPNPNEIGNYCIAGHNYKKKNMFYRLIELDIGDHIFLTDNFNGTVEYTIYDIYKVKPENVESLSQETRAEKEITLITCVNYSTRRLVVKAIAV